MREPSPDGDSPIRDLDPLDRIPYPHNRRCFGAGALRGLQSRWTGASPPAGGFDSHAPPPRDQEGGSAPLLCSLRSLIPPAGGCSPADVKSASRVVCVAAWDSKGGRRPSPTRESASEERALAAEWGKPRDPAREPWAALERSERTPTRASILGRAGSIPMRLRQEIKKGALPPSCARFAR